MPTYIKELPTQAWLQERFYEVDGILYHNKRAISRGRWSTKAGKRVATNPDAAGYLRMRMLGQTFAVARVVYQLVFGGLTPKFEVDHLDRDKTNNKPSNLRMVSGDVNKRNRPKSCVCASGETGVLFNRKFRPEPHSHKYTDYYGARWRDAEGKERSKYFSVAKYGEERAFTLAKEYREARIAELRAAGHGYTETHGKEQND